MTITLCSRRLVVEFWSNEHRREFGAGGFAIAIMFAVAVLQIPTNANAQTVKDFQSAISKHEKYSPAGGASKNPKAAVLVLFRKSQKLGIVRAGKLKTVVVVSPAETDDTKNGGPTPVGEYLIGMRRKHPDQKIDWYNLYPRIEDNSGYYGYSAETKKGRSAMGLHPGKISLGCATVRSDKDPYDSDPNWESIRAVVDSGELKYKNDDFRGFLYVVDH